MDRGFPDDALRLASAAVDVFFKDGNKPGESRALSCVAQAMAWGATLNGSATSSAALRQRPEVVGSSMSLEMDSFGAQESTTVGLIDTTPWGVVEDSRSSMGLTDLSELPISYGERLILETCVRCRQRPYDRERQEALSRPRRGGKDVGVDRSAGERSLPTVSGGVSCEPSTQPSTARSSTSQDTRRLNMAQTDQLVNRLSTPRRHQKSAKPPAEQLPLRSQERSAKPEAGGLAIASMVARLSAPRSARALSPTPGERVVLMWNRSENLRKPDLERLNRLAIASRRGGTAAAWGVRPWEARPWTATAPVLAPMSQVPLPPDSAREAPRPQPAAIQDAGPPSEGSPCPEPALLPFDSQEMGQTWHHPWRSDLPPLTPKC